MKITLGSDPELHLFDMEQRRVVSSIRVLKRDKNKPIPLGNDRFMYSDNVLTEVSFPPADTIDGLIEEMRNVFVAAQKALTDRYRFLPVAAYVYEKRDLLGKKPWMIGCNPNFNAYTNKPNVINKFSSNLRTGSFHIHIGHEKIDNNDEVRDIAKLLDIFVGCSSVLFDRDETAGKRRALYGQAGEHRPTPYGLEWRVLGNWALRSPIITRLALDLVAHTISIYDAGECKAVLEAVGEVRPQLAINTNDKAVAEGVLDVVGLPSGLSQRIKQDYGIPEFNVAWEI